jgi:hypothetical protein
MDAILDQQHREVAGATAPTVIRPPICIRTAPSPSITITGGADSGH